jgi:hypothetical protein
MNFSNAQTINVKSDNDICFFSYMNSTTRRNNLFYYFPIWLISMQYIFYPNDYEFYIAEQMKNLIWRSFICNLV